MCDKMIAEACNFSLPTSENTEVNKCNKVMGDFRRDTDACVTSSTNCSCWNNLVNDIQGVKDCNIGRFKLYLVLEFFLSDIIYSWTKGKGNKEEADSM